MIRPMRRAVILAAGVSLALAACGGDSGPSFDMDGARKFLELRQARGQDTTIVAEPYLQMLRDGCLANGVERKGHELALAQIDAVAGGPSLATTIEILFCDRPDES